MLLHRTTVSLAELDAAQQATWVGGRYLYNLGLEQRRDFRHRRQIKCGRRAVPGHLA